MESLSRLWWFAENPNMPYKIVFLDFPFGGGFTAYSVLEALGITRDRMEIITEPTRFKEIIVPEESIYMWSGFRAGWETVFNSNFAHRFCLCTLKIQYLAGIRLSKFHFLPYAA